MDISVSNLQLKVTPVTLIVSGVLHRVIGVLR